MSEVTAPIMTDATGQSIDSKLNSLLGKMDNLAAAFQPNASGIVYSNTTSGLTGDDVQEAIDEMAADVSEIKQSLSQLDGLVIYKDLTPTDDYAEFNDGSNLPLLSLISTIEPIQSGSGTPSPDNPRSISGHTDIDIIVSPNSDFSGGTTYSVNFVDGGNPLTVYGGTIDVVSGVLTVTHGFVVIDNTITSNKVSIQFSAGGLTVVRVVTGMPAVNDNNQICNIATYNANAWQSSGSENVFVMGSEGNVYLRVSSSLITTQSDALTFFANTPMQIVYELATPQTYQLTHTQVNTLLGQNYISSDVGDITNVKYLRILNLG